MVFWISMIIFCMIIEVWFYVFYNVNKFKLIFRIKFVKVLLWNEFFLYIYNFIVGLVWFMNIVVLLGRKS